MSKADELREEAKKLREKSKKKQAAAWVVNSASDEAALRYDSEKDKVNADELERKADQTEKDERAGEKSGLF